MMAEVLGLAAGIAGLGSIAIQLGQCAMAIRRFQRTFRAAPKTLDAVAREIETLAVALQHLEQHCSIALPEGQSRNALLECCIAACSAACDRLAHVTEKMQRLIESRRAYGRLYFALREQELREMSLDIERAKTSLLLAVME